jgi:hypothetical protein
VWRLQRRGRFACGMNRLCDRSFRTALSGCFTPTNPADVRRQARDTEPESGVLLQPFVNAPDALPSLNCGFDFRPERFDLTGLGNRPFRAAPGEAGAHESDPVMRIFCFVYAGQKEYPLSSKARQRGVETREDFFFASGKHPLITKGLCSAFRDAETKISCSLCCVDLALCRLGAGEKKNEHRLARWCAASVQNRTLATDCDNSRQFAAIIDTSKVLRQKTTTCDKHADPHLSAEAAKSGSGT